MSTKNPFDLSDMLKKFDATAMTEQYKEFFGKFNMPNLDMTALKEAQNKNVQAMTAANRAMLEGTQALMKRQSEMLKQVVSEASEAAKSLGSSASNPQEAIQNQIKMLEKSVSEALANFAEISEMVKNTQDETTKVMTTRFNDSMAELRSTIGKLKPEGGKDAG
jgi:phasin family protein